MVIFPLRKFIKKIDSTQFDSLTTASTNFRPQVSKLISSAIPTAGRDFESSRMVFLGRARKKDMSRFKRMRKLMFEFVKSRELKDDETFTRKKVQSPTNYNSAPIVLKNMSE
jgi:hypothetical protein